MIQAENTNYYENLRRQDSMKKQLGGFSLAWLKKYRRAFNNWIYEVSAWIASERLTVILVPLIAAEVSAILHIN